MKSIVISVLMLSMTLFFVSCENEGQLTQSASDVEKQILDKKPLKAESIIFEGDLEGEQNVVGCCPNAGPFPEYTLTLSSTFGELSRTYDGEIFMNKAGRKPNQSYMVQFWWTEGGTDYFIEIRGGDIEEDKKNKILTATFTNASCVIEINGTVTGSPVTVNFTLTRAKL